MHEEVRFEPEADSEGFQRAGGHASRRWRCHLPFNFSEIGRRLILVASNTLRNMNIGSVIISSGTFCTAILSFTTTSSTSVHITGITAATISGSVVGGVGTNIFDAALGVQMCQQEV